MTELIRSDDLPKAETMPQTIARLEARLTALDRELMSLRELFANHLARANASADHVQTSLVEINERQSRLGEKLDVVQTLALRLVSASTPN